NFCFRLYKPYNASMTYVEIAIADAKYHSKYPLTYKTELTINIGDIVKAPLRGRVITGVVTSIVDKPNIKLKEILEILDLPSLPKETIAILSWMRDYYASTL